MLMVYILQFTLAVTLVLLYYKLIETRNIKKYTKNNIPTDLKLFIYTQKVNLKKIKYKSLMRLVAGINAIDIGIILLITNIVDNMLLKLLIAIPASFILLYISYKAAGFVLKKKGMTINES